MAVTTVVLTCENCNIEFSRNKNEYNRSIRKGWRIYCSNKCSGVQNHKHLGVFAGQFNDNLNFGSSKDEFSPYRHHLLNCRTHCKNTTREVSITLQDLKEQWDKQNGLCPYTGWVLENPDCQGRKSKFKGSPKKASLDRIDSSKGYTKDNIQFVCMMAQYAKHAFSGEQLIEFCKAVAENNMPY